MKHKNITTQDLCKLLREGDHILIDIREPEEHTAESIPGAANIPLSQLASCKCPKQATPVFHCKSGMRTQMAAGKLAQWAGRDILILEGGIEAWRGAGQTTTKG